MSRECPNAPSGGDGGGGMLMTQLAMLRRSLPLLAYSGRRHCGCEKRVAQPKVCVHYGVKHVKSLGFYRVFLFQINAHDAIGYVENEMRKFCSELQLKEKSNHIIQKTIKLFLLLKNEEKLQTP